MKNFFVYYDLFNILKGTYKKANISNSEKLKINIIYLKILGFLHKSTRSINFEKV